jgi:hypothetical protein
MANLSYSNTPLIADLYDTPEAAIAASINLGCSGYRTYNINGQNKYVPCGTYLAYEQALKFVKRQGVQNAISGKGNIGDKAVGLQFANNNNEIAGDPFFTLGNFSINTSVSQKPAIGKTAKISPETRQYTAASINDLNPNKNTDATTNLVDTINAKIENNLTVTILFDKKKLENYVLYSPLKETVKNTIVEISQKYPAALKLNVTGLLSPTVIDYSYNTNKDTSEFKININNIENPFDIEYTVTGTLVTDNPNITPIRNFSKKYRDFVLYYNDIEYKILNVTLPNSKTDTDNGIYLVVQGNPFGDVVNNNQTVNKTFWLKPSLKKFDEFQSGLSDMGKFLMDYDYELKRYVSVIRYTKVTDSGVRLNTEERLVFPQSDSNNIDIFSSDFDVYLTKLNRISDDFDETKTNLISRFLTTDSLKEFDTDDRKIKLMFGLIGKNFDNIRKYIDGITFMTNLTYDKIENIPDLLVKNFGNMLGFETYNVEDENTIIESLFNIKDLNVEPGLTPAEIDIELWRRIFINAYYLWKSKGTRKSIEFILNLVGLPDSIFEISEHVYMARNPINYTDKSYEIYGNNYSDETLLTLLPFDKDGYPTVPHDVRYQESGFTTTNDGRNFGPYDFGKQYIQAFEKRGNVDMFTVDRYVDNVKSWAYSTEEVLRLSDDSVGYTEYYEPNSKLVINSKELEVYLASDKIFDLSIYRYYNRNAVDINSDLTFRVVPTINGGDLTFNQFLQKSLDNYIKPDNRKTIKTYPTLTKIYYDYLNSVSSPMTNTKDLEFLSYFDSSWVKLVQQFTPATTILNAGKKIQNSKFMDNKFIYKHGLNNSVSWLGTDGSEFQDLAKKTVNQGLINPFNTIGVNKLPIAGESSTFTLEGLRGKNYVGYDPTINEYFGFYYGIEEACASELQIYKWEDGLDFGNDTIHFGNVNVGNLESFGLGNPAYGPNYYPTSKIITLPDGPGTYLLAFKYASNDDLYVYNASTNSNPSLIATLGSTGTISSYSAIVTVTGNTISVYNDLNNGFDCYISDLFVIPLTEVQKKGTFITYDNKLYRLNTNTLFINPTQINTYPEVKKSYVLLDAGYISDTITLPNGPGDYKVTFTLSGDDVIIYDGYISGATTSSSTTQIDSFSIVSGTTKTYSANLTLATNYITIRNIFTFGNDATITNLVISQKHTPDSLTVNSEMVYEYIPFDADAKTLTFKDSDSILLMPDPISGNTHTVKLPEGPGTYQLTFTTDTGDDMRVYDGKTIAGTLLITKARGAGVVNHSSSITSTTGFITFYNIGNVNTPNKIIDLKLDGVPLDATSLEERNYYIEAISFGHAHLAADVDFLCPIPKPHTCYFNFSGNTISMATAGITDYYDESGKYLTIEQSKYYGYSKNTVATKPNNALYGTTSNWIIPYQKENIWTTGVTYYKGDIVKYPSTGSTYYEVTFDTVTGTTTTPTGATVTTIVPGLYQHYTGRTTTDPYMHINSANIKKNLINPLSDIISFNLTKSLYLYQVYSGATDQETYKVIDNLLNDELYISDSNTLSFDGFYSLDETKVGPFYTPNVESIGIQTLVESIDLVPDTNNYIDFESLNTNFNFVNSNISLSNGYYLIKQNKYFKFDIDLFFESELIVQQSVIIKLIDQFGGLIHEQLFTFSGADVNTLRVVNFTHEGVFFTDTKVYLVIEPVTEGCRLSRYETIDVDYANAATYDSLDDPRFRVYFNGGRGLINNHYFDDALSIEPIGYNDNHTVDNYLLKLENTYDTYEFIPKLNINQSYGEDYNFGLLYGRYFEKYKNTSQIGDVTSYEKKFNNDYVNFELTVRSKELNNTPQYYTTGSTPQIYYSFAGSEKTYTISSTGNYLGNTPQAVENTSITKNIFIGKTPKPRVVNLNRPNYPFLKLYNNDVELTGTTINFLGYDDGLDDYNQLDFSGDLVDSLISKKRYKLITGSTYGYLKKENDVYKTELYQDILSVVPYFSTSINNYVINDIVKVKLSNYRKVVESTTGTTVETTDVERLYVCVEDITADHLCKISGYSSTFEIHPIYRPNGARTCFIPIENYNLKNFTPIGYDKQIIFDTTRSNVAPYRYREPIILDGTPTQKLDLGDIVKTYASGSGSSTVYTLYEYVYNKPLTWDSTNNYYLGEIVYYPGSNFATDAKYSFWYNVNSSTGTPPGGAGWYEMPVTGTNANSPFWIKDITGITTNPNFYTNGPAAYRVKNLLPTVSSVTGYDYRLPLTGTTNIAIADAFYRTLPGDTNGIEEHTDVIDYFRITGSTLDYTGTSNSLMTFTGTQDTNLIQNSYTYTLVNGLLYGFTFPQRLVGQVFWMYYNPLVNIQPLFHNVGTTAEDNGILDFIATGTTYNSNSNYHSKKYTVSRNVLYRTVPGIGTFTNAIEPHLSTNWEERDFMLVNKFTFKKDRCRVSIYEGTIESINTLTKNNLYFFDSNLKLKTGFTEQTFSGATTNEKLLNGVNKLFDAKNTNLRSVKNYGLTGFRKVGSDIIMDYYYEKDDNGLPFTGEFIGGLTITNPCGHTAKTIFGALFEADLTKLDQLSPRIMTPQALPENIGLITRFRPEVRLIINQNGASNVTVIVENNTAGTTVFNKVLTKNKYFDENVIVNYGESITITIKTDITRNLSRYTSGFMDNYTLFDANDNGIENGYFVSTKTNVSRLVTRTIKLKDINEGRVVKIDFDGATIVTAETVDPRDYIKLP